MSKHNYEAGIQMTMAIVTRNYLRWFELHKFKRAIAAEMVLARRRDRWSRLLPSGLGSLSSSWNFQSGVLPNSADGIMEFDGMDASKMKKVSPGLTTSSRRMPSVAIEHTDEEWYDTNPELKNAG
jgi:hypothetical protein